MRTLGIMKLLYTYGGFRVPSSYVPLQSLQQIYQIGLQTHNVFVCETKNNTITSTYTETFPNHMFMGCKKEEPIMKEFVSYIEHLNSRDFTSQSDFLGSINRKCYEYIHNNRMGLIDGTIIGTKSTHNKPILIDNLLQTSYIEFSENMNGILIPDEDILKRTKYQWFARMSPEQILNSELIISKYILLSTQ
jgi:hypothetical protein